MVKPFVKRHGLFFLQVASSHGCLHEVRRACKVMIVRQLSVGYVPLRRRAGAEATASLGPGRGLVISDLSEDDSRRPPEGALADGCSDDTIAVVRPGMGGSVFARAPEAARRKSCRRFCPLRPDLGSHAGSSTFTRCDRRPEPRSNIIATGNCEQWPNAPSPSASNLRASGLARHRRRVGSAAAAIED